MNQIIMNKTIWYSNFTTQITINEIMNEITIITQLLLIIPYYHLKLVNSSNKIHIIVAYFMHTVIPPLLQ